MKKLTISTTDKMIGGVCGGLGEYLEIDSVLIRVIFVIMGLAGGGVILYLILWLAMPTEDRVGANIEENVRRWAEEIRTKAENFASGVKVNDSQERMWGWLIILAGILLLLSNFGILSFLRFDLMWPAMIILLGVYVILKRK
jgi:phage shock protein PspC (stress-responsive transcriptional regulator)